MIPVLREEDPEPPLEGCVFCGVGTAYWTNLPDRTPGEQVTCCRKCAGQREPAEVPTKEAWFKATAWRGKGG